MKIHMLECNKIHDALKLHEPGLVGQFDQWVEGKSKVDAQFTEKNEKIAARYCELRDKYLGGPLCIVKAQNILDIEHNLNRKGQDTFCQDAEAGTVILREWLKFRQTVHMPYDKEITRTLKNGCGYVIISNEAYEIYKKYMTEA